MHSKTKISKTLSWILRHGAYKVDIKLDSNGWADLEHILALPQFKNESIDTIFTIVKECPKQRFSLKESEGTTYIKARQGHSIKGLDLELKPIVSADAQPFVYHGTYYKVWSKIQKEGLSRMKRVHIHFAPFPPKSRQDCSGIRKNCQLIIEVDVSTLLKDGYKLWRSDNNVILCEGNEKGFIPSSYFKSVLERRRG